ncbi:something about silencing protein 10-like [Anneissia japonica]|uniref:something about silencing protein 10-like n=1 Tax=Anneissia japonica TaxID=1529436 RepID=UPI001425520C|nr:something about silencing protein 10-like [Anneissia japonica]
MKKKGRGRAKFQRKEETFDSDDERAYKDLPVPDAHNSIYDEIDDFHKNRLKKMNKKFQEQERASSDDEVEVLSLDSDNDDDYEAQLLAIKKQSHLEDVASDMEDEDAEDDDALPNEKAWGSRKKSFYHTDYVDDDLPGLSEEEEEQAEEEKEALAIQQRMAQALDEEDFGMDLFKVDDKGDNEDDVESRIVKDLSKLSKKEKLQHLQKDSPELFQLIAEFKDKIRELIDTMYPLAMMVKAGHIPSGQPATYINTKFHLHLNYCINVSFYFALKSKQASVRDHPIIKRILTYRNLIQELKPIDEQLSGDIQNLLKVYRVDGNMLDKEEDENTGIMNVKHQHREKSKKRGKTFKEADDREPSVHKKKAQKVLSLTEEEQAALEYYRIMEQKVLQKKQEKEDLMRESEQVVEDEEDNEDENAKRAITYQMSKNKGLTVKKKKEHRNPRVKHRMKFRRAKIRRKGQVREPTTEKQRYSGEATGIRAGVIKSVKLQ